MLKSFKLQIKVATPNQQRQISKLEQYFWGSEFSICKIESRKIMPHFELLTQTFL